MANPLEQQMKRQLGLLLKKISEDIKHSVVENLYVAFHNELIPAIVENIMVVYDEELAGAPPEDPANPDFARSYFRAAVEADLLNSLTEEKETLSLAVGDLSTFGYDHHTLSYLKRGIPRGSGAARPLDWLVFYLEGFIGEFIFITKEEVHKVKPNITEFGWFGEGFLLPVGAYKDLELGKYGIPFRRHPFSGKKPSRIFENAVRGLSSKIDEFVDAAIVMALSEVGEVSI
jgi:hypothetical protein